MVIARQQSCRYSNAKYAAPWPVPVRLLLNQIARSFFLSGRSRTGPVESDSKLKVVRSYPDPDLCAPMSDGPLLNQVRPKTEQGPAKTGHGPGRENEVGTVPVQCKCMFFFENMCFCG